MKSAAASVVMAEMIDAVALVVRAVEKVLPGGDTKVYYYLH